MDNILCRKKEVKKKYIFRTKPGGSRIVKTPKSGQKWPKRGLIEGQEAWMWSKNLISN